MSKEDGFFFMGEDTVAEAVAISEGIRLRHPDMTTRLAMDTLHSWGSLSFVGPTWSEIEEAYAINAAIDEERALTEIVGDPMGKSNARRL